MAKRIILNDGNDIPWLGFGTGSVLYDKNVTQLVCQLIEAGVTHFDGARGYKNEHSLGEGISVSGTPRSTLFLTTKLHLLSGDQTVKGALIESLKKLGFSYVDLFLIHDPTPHQREGRLKEIWTQMEQVKDEGFAKSIGVSNFKVSDLEEILPDAKIIPSVNQVGRDHPTTENNSMVDFQIELHPYVWKAAQPVVEFGEKHGIITASYGGATPLARVPNGPLKDVLPVIRARLEHRHGIYFTEGQVLTKWILQKGAIVITTSTKVARIKEFLDTEHVPDLTKEDIEAIEEAGSKLHQRIYMRHVYKD